MAVKGQTSGQDTGVNVSGNARVETRELSPEAKLVSATVGKYVSENLHKQLDQLLPATDYPEFAKLPTLKELIPADQLEEFAHFGNLDAVPTPTQAQNLLARKKPAEFTDSEKLLQQAVQAFLDKGKIEASANPNADRNEQIVLNNYFGRFSANIDKGLV